MAKKQETYRIYACKNGSQIISPVTCGCAPGKPAAKKKQAPKPTAAKQATKPSVKPQAKAKTTPKSAPKTAKAAPAKKPSSDAVKPGKMQTATKSAPRATKLPTANKMPTKATKPAPPQNPTPKSARTVKQTLSKGNSFSGRKVPEQQPYRNPSGRPTLQVNQQNVPVYERMPQGWQTIAGAMTAPVGYVWIHNDKSVFSGKRRHALLRLNNR